MSATGKHDQGRGAPPREVAAPFYDRLSIGGAVAAAPAGPPPAPLGLRALIVGGSIAGCCAALALQELGCQVDIFEQSSGDLRSEGAGLVVQPDLEAFLLHFKVCERVEDLCVRSAGRQYVDRTGTALSSSVEEQLFCGWDVLYRALRAALPPGVYHPHSMATAVSVAPDGTTVTLQEGAQRRGDLLIGADGPGSLVRRTLCPGVRSTYAGYVAWRGFVEESEAPRDAAAFLRDRFSVYQAAHFHILAYVIPGTNGERERGRRRINWVWYWRTPEGEHDRILTDATGHRHGYSVPRGLLRPEVAEERKAVAAQVLPAPFAALVAATPDIFVQTIQDLLAPSFVFGGRACLVGDSGCSLRPHTAAGTTKAAVNSWTLARALAHHPGDLEAALGRYEAEMRPVAESLVALGQRIGQRSVASPGGG